MRMRSFDSISSRLAATSSTLISTPSPSGSRIWKSSSTDSMSNGTCCSASQRISSRACCSLTRSIWIFLMMTSRPPTAVTTCVVFTSAAASAPWIASATMPGSMTSPSTIASASKGNDGDTDQLRLALGVVDHRDLDQARTDVEADRGFVATKQCHWEVRRGGGGEKGGGGREKRRGEKGGRGTEKSLSEDQ